MSRLSHALEVRSHVARDLLQNAALFKTEKLVVWEYVSNSLQYIDPGTNPVVKVGLDARRKKITVEDNGRGMDWDGLRNFFVMHGENADRNTGNPGRGRFGTGKAAAFGIADLLRVTTIKRRRRSRVELQRSDIITQRLGDPISVKVLEQETHCPRPNGTIVEIENIHLKTLDDAGVVRYIERHLAHSPNATVFVNRHVCEPITPAVSFSRICRPTVEMCRLIGEVELVLYVSKGPLEPDSCGVSIYSNGVWYENTLAGSEGKELSNYIFGEIEVPALDRDCSPIAPFDLSRSMRLNPNNETVQALYAFINRSVEELRYDLLEQDKRRKASEEALQFKARGDEIAQLINEDFDLFRSKVADVRSSASKKDGASRTEPEPDSGVQMSTRVSPKSEKSAQEAQEAPSQIDSAHKEELKKTGFRVEFKAMGSEQHRAAYSAQERTIYINLDHPQLLTSRRGGEIDDVPFRRLVREVAFTEYATALARELAHEGEYLDPTDSIAEIRETIDRLARRSEVP